MRKLSRRAFLQISAGGLASSAAAVAFAQSRFSSTPSVASPTPEAASPLTHMADWNAEWDATTAAAKTEGKLSLITLVGRGYTPVIERFERAFPGVKVEHLAESSGSAWQARVRNERRDRVRPFDLALVRPFEDKALTVGRAENMWAPLRPLLFRPDVLDDGMWRDGVNARFMDQSGDLCFDWEYNVLHAFAINTDLVQEGEIRSVSDLLDPRWRGKLLLSEPRLGTGLFSMASVANSMGRDAVRRLLKDQRPEISSGGLRNVTDALVHGRVPIALGVRPKALEEFRAEGLADKVKFLDLPEADFQLGPAVFHFDRAPHPAAAKLFANWILTKEGQSLLTSNLPTNSARTDVPPGDPDGIGGADKRYYEPDREATYLHTADTQKLVFELLS
jgi:iron(III) transport system substrate-binding protein